jgi:hypothetical protein
VLDPRLATIESRLRNWRDIWEDQVASFNVNSRGLELRGPQVILLYLFDELRLGGLRNKANRAFICEELRYYIDSDEMLSKSGLVILFKRILEEIREISKTPDKIVVSAQLIELCDQSTTEFLRGKYFDALLAELVWWITDLSKDYRPAKIAVLTRNAIVAMMFQGFALKTIGEIPSRLLDNVTQINDYVFTRFPAITTSMRPFFEGTRFDRKKYSAALKLEMDGLTPTQRLNGLRTLFHAFPRRYNYMLRVAGLTGLRPLQVGEVQFYSPRLRPLITCNHAKDELDLSSAPGYMNASITLEALDPIAGLAEAVEKTARAVDLIHYFLNPHTLIVVSADNYVVADETYHSVASGSGTDTRNPDAFDGLLVLRTDGQFDRAAIDSLTKLAEDLQTKGRWLNGKFEAEMAYKYYRKAEESVPLEDKILNYWISVENVLSTKGERPLLRGEDVSIEATCREVLSALGVLARCREVFWDLYLFLNNIFRNQELGNLRPGVNIGRREADELGLTLPLGKSLEIKDFLAAAKRLQPNVSNVLVNDVIEYSVAFYADPTFALKELKRTRQSVRDLVTVIYQFRNRLVHEATVNMRMLPYFTQRLRTFNIGLLSIITRATERGGVVEAIADAIVRADLVVDRLSSKEPVDLLNVFA